MASRYRFLKGFTFGSCHVRSRKIIGFTAQKWLDNDPLEQRETALFFYYPEKPDDRKWAVSGIGHATGVSGCAPFLPEERWIFVTDDGQVYVVGKGDDAYEDPISKKPTMYFSRVKAVRNGHAIAIGPKRHVFLRRGPSQWARLDVGLYPNGEATDLEGTGFSDIDGFSEHDIYACGGISDLWHYDGSRWMQVSVPTNAALERICCSEDGFAYVTTNLGGILRGRGDAWEFITNGRPDEPLECIVGYGSQTIVSTASSLYFVDASGFRRANLGEPPMRAKPHLAAGDGVLVVAGGDEAAMFDGSSWTVVLATESP
jgi:hypothetical protein